MLRHRRIPLSRVSEPCDDPGKQELFAAGLAFQNYYLISLSELLQSILKIKPLYNNRF